MPDPEPPNFMNEYRKHWPGNGGQVDTPAPEEENLDENEPEEPTAEQEISPKRLTHPTDSGELTASQRAEIELLQTLAVFKTLDKPTGAQVGALAAVCDAWGRLAIARAIREHTEALQAPAEAFRVGADGHFESLGRVQ